MTVPAQPRRTNNISLVLDILFGVVPALLFGALSVIGMGGALNSSHNYGFDGSVLAALLLGLVGLFACLSLIAAIVTRGRLRGGSQTVCLVGLCTGTLIALIVALLYLSAASLSAGAFDGLSWVGFALSLAITAVATKYILILTLWRTP